MMGHVGIKYPYGSSTPTGSGADGILTIFDDVNSMFITFEDGTILVGA